MRVSAIAALVLLTLWARAFFASDVGQGDAAPPVVLERTTQAPEPAPSDIDRALYPSPAKPAAPPPDEKTIPITVRAYCPCYRCNAGAHDGKTAIGWAVYPGQRYIAVSRDVEVDLPMKTVVRIPGLTTPNETATIGGEALEPDEWAIVDRTAKSRRNQIEVLISWALPRYRTAHSTAWHFPTFKGVLVYRGGGWAVDWPHSQRAPQGEPRRPFPWETLGFALQGPEKAVE